MLWSSGIKPTNDIELAMGESLKGVFLIHVRINHTFDFRIRHSPIVFIAVKDYFAFNWHPS